MKHLVKFEHLHMNKVTETNQLKEAVMGDTSSEEIFREDSKLKTLDTASALEAFKDNLFGNMFNIEPPKDSLPVGNRNEKLEDNLQTSNLIKTKRSKLDESQAS